MTLAVVIAIFVVMLLAPVVGGYVAYRVSSADVLFINATKVKDPRYFAKSFEKIILNAFDGYDGSGALELSRKAEAFFLAADGLPEECDRLVVSLDDVFDTGRTKSFEREILVCGNAIVREGCEMRALRAMGTACLGEGVLVDRWVDAEGTLCALDGCDLGISATSASRLVIGGGCRFHRLYAPRIDVGCRLDDAFDPEPIWRSPFVSKNVIWNKSSLGTGDCDERYDDENALDEGVVVGTVITPSNLKVLEGIVVAGHVRSHGSVRLCDGAVVFGNVFAESNVMIGDGCRVLGTVFSQEDVYVGDGSVVGVAGQLRSIIARGRIVFHGQARVHGYVSTEGGGRIDGSPGRNSAEGLDLHARPPEEIPLQSAECTIVSPSAEELETGGATYRKDDRIVGAVLPSGIKAVPRSLFFMCSKLGEVSFPESIEAIEDFAFFGCESVRELDLRSCTSLKEIGASAFEGCVSLESIVLPASLETVGEAAFRNCPSLKTVLFESPASIVAIGTHAFMGCSSLPSFEIPRSVRHLGMSAFFECTSLERLRLPKGIQTIGAYFVAECTSLELVSSPRDLTEAELVGMPDGVSVVVRQGGPGLDEGDFGEEA